MTLVLSVATPEYVLQVSDRQLTYPDGRVADSNRNKVVIWPPHSVFGYTGLGSIGGQPTDVWLYKTLSGIKHSSNATSVNQVLDMLAERASQAFRKIAFSQKHHCFVAMGWVAMPEHGGHAPMLATVSNAQDERGHWLQSPRSDFSVRLRVLHGAGKYLMEITGQDIHVQAKRLIRRLMSRPTSAHSAARLLLTILQAEASTNWFVGSRSLIVSVPKSTLGQVRTFFVSGLPCQQHASVLYIGEKGEPDHYFPPFVDLLTGVHFAPLPEDLRPHVSEPWSAIILTERRVTKNDLGEDSWDMGVCMDYSGKGRGWSDLTSAQVVPPGYTRPNPYYGLLVGLRLHHTDDNVVGDIERDEDHLVITSSPSDESVVPSVEWIEQLGAWLRRHSMPSFDCDRFLARVGKLPRGQIVKELNRLLSTPVHHLDSLDQQTGDSQAPSH